MFPLHGRQRGIGAEALEKAREALRKADACGTGRGGCWRTRLAVQHASWTGLDLWDRRVGVKWAAGERVVHRGAAQPLLQVGEAISANQRQMKEPRTCAGSFILVEVLACALVFRGEDSEHAD